MMGMKSNERKLPKNVRIYYKNNYYGLVHVNNFLIKTKPYYSPEQAKYRIEFLRNIYQNVSNPFEFYMQDENRSEYKIERLLSKAQIKDSDSEIVFTYAYTGLENQKVYRYRGYVQNKMLFIEMINYVNGTWAYHCENYKGLVCDSRISNRYYNSLEECKDALLKSLDRKKYFKYQKSSL